jgi:hypothetical protein
MLAFADDAALARLVIAAGVAPLHIYRLEAFRSRDRGHARAASNGLRTTDILRGTADEPPPLLHASAPPP